MKKQKIILCLILLIAVPLSAEQNSTSIAENALLRTINILSKIPRECMELVLQSATAKQLIDMYKAADMLSYLHMQEKEESDYPRTEIQRLQQKLFTSPADGNFILLKALERAQKLVVKKIECTEYTPSELQTNFLRAIAPSYEGNWIEYLEHLPLINTSDLEKMSRTLSNPHEISQKTQNFVKRIRKGLKKIDSLESTLKSDLQSYQVSIVPSQFGSISPTTCLSGTIKTPYGQKEIVIKLDTGTAVWFFDINNNKFWAPETENGIQLNNTPQSQTHTYDENSQGNAELLNKIVTLLEKNIDIKDLPHFFIT